MDKPTLVADVRSILRRSFPETNNSESTPLRIEGETSQMKMDDLSEFGLSQTRDMMNVLQMATVLSRLLPDVQLVLTNKSTQGEPAQPVLAFPSRNEERASTMRAALNSSFRENVPAAIEALLFELGVIERQDRSYYCSRDHERDATMAWVYRQRRRSDVLAEINDLEQLTEPECS